jgi:hypothetical protein
MIRLANRQQQIPGGFVFREPSTGWTPRPFTSFESICEQIFAFRQGNPFLAQKNQWATDMEGIRREVDFYNARVCQMQGWTQYIITDAGTAPPPKTQTPQQQSAIANAAGVAKRIWSGVRSLNAWDASGDPAVPAELSAKRAAICAVCPKNGQGDLTRWFTVPASEVIKRQLERKEARKLSTPDDAKLNICEVCLCPMKLKVHEPLQYLKAHTLPEVLADLKAVPSCWLPAEIQAA